LLNYSTSYAPLALVPDDIDGILWVSPYNAGAAHQVYKLDAGIKAIVTHLPWM